MSHDLNDDRIGRYFRRYQLGLRFIAHAARSRTTTEWCGLTRDQLATLRRRWDLVHDEHQRGPAPTSLQIFFRSARQRNQATIFAALFRILSAKAEGALSEPSGPFVSLENGEIFCDALEAYREWQPESKLEFEYALLLARSITLNSQIRLSRCASCGLPILSEPHVASRDRCEHCGNRRLARQRLNRRMVGNEKDEEAEGSHQHHAERETRTDDRSFEGNRRDDSDQEQCRANSINDGREES